MSRTLLVTSLSAAVALVLIVAGCAKRQASEQPSTSPEASQAQSAATEGETHAGQQQVESGMAGMSEQGESGMAKMTGHDMAGMSEHAAGATDNKYEDVLAQLSPEDQALAKKQKVCPVSGEPLGAMGKPYKVTVEGREVLLCCPGCEAKIKANPQEYLAKLPQ
jgi:outer membrane murein-binding lipoprotein Lpp